MNKQIKVDQKWIDEIIQAMSPTLIPKRIGAELVLSFSGGELVLRLNGNNNGSGYWYFNDTAD